MIQRIVILAAIFCGLFYWEGQLSSSRSSERSSSSRLRPLMEESFTEGLLVAGVRVETASDESFLYARSRGVWRLLEPAVNTYAKSGAVEQLMQSLVDASGVMLTNKKHRAKSYGFGSDIALRISLLGTKLKTADDGDVLYTIDIGYPIQGTEGAYVRPFGTNEVWSIDLNPRNFLARPPGSGFPPMLDPNVIPAVSAAPKGGLIGVKIVSQVTENFEVRMITNEANPEQPGGTITTWELVRENGTRVVCDEIPARGYSIYLLLAPYSAILGADSVDSEVLDDPDIRMTITPAQGEPFELLFGRPNAKGGRTVANMDTRTMFEISADVAELMLPDAETVAEESRGNPWHDFIQVNPIAGRNLLQNPINPR